MGKKLFPWKAQIVFIITGAFIGLLVTAQLKSVLPSSSYPYDKFQAQQELVKGYNDEQSLLKSKILNLRKQIEDKQKEAGETIQKNNLDVLSELKKEIGLESIKGGGIEMTIDDSMFAKRDSVKNPESLVNAADLRDIVNLLFSAQFNGVAINGHRVIASTPINSVGNTILVNNSNVLPPFVILGIGDSDLILQRLNDPKTLSDLRKRVKSQKIRFTFSGKDNLVLPIYNSDFQLKYIQSSNDSSK